MKPCSARRGPWPACATPTLFRSTESTGALFLVFIRLSGGVIASVFEHTFGLVSRKLGHAVGHKIRTFRTGLDTIRSFSDFATTASLSIAMWALIAAAYFETMRAFVASPQLRSEERRVGKE